MQPQTERRTLKSKCLRILFETDEQMPMHAKIGGILYDHAENQAGPYAEKIRMDFTEMRRPPKASKGRALGTLSPSAD